ncbi:MAG: DNA gyrase inhibitor YacG [Labilithrix sp.]|nr:DNA gyrase inhibitor YacG [Labilithrix sp.]MCW5809493.1 DNA gyrase inhibitor YacG [Labilithrix sp.]
MAICPICGSEAKPRAENPSFPFCAPRCKTIDLGKWMDEEYRIPADDSPDEDDHPDDEIVRH